MPTPKSSLIIKQYDSFGGSFVDSDYLAAAYETGKPTYLEGMMMKIYSSQSRFFKVKPFLSLTGSKSNGGKEITSEIVRWRLQGAEYKCARVVENVEAALTTPGMNNTTFRIKLDLDYYHYPDVLVSEDNDYSLQVTEGPVPDGTGFIYTVRLMNENPTAFMPPAYMEAGHEFSKVTTAVPQEFNQWFGTQQYPDAFLLEAQLGAFGQEMTVTDKAWRDGGKLGYEFQHTDYNGSTSTVTKFQPYAEAVMMDEMYSSIEWALTYGKRTTFQGPDKYWQKTGAGIREQLKDGWIMNYSGALSVALLQDYLMQVFFGRADESQRSVKLMTGTLGSILFHNALAAVANGFLTVDTHFVREAPNPGSPTPGLAYGAQFTRYTGAQGVVVDLMLNPLYDDLRYCKTFHPLYPEYPIDSARMTILDFSSYGIASNIELLKVKDTFYYGYVPGMLTPSGPITSGVMGSHKAGYSVAVQGTAGVVIRDVTRCGELILSAEA